MNPVDALLNEVRDAMDNSGRAQVVIARDLGISEKHLSNFMQGYTDVRLPLLRRMCDLMGMTR